MLDLNIPGTSKSTGILQGYQYYMLKHENFSTARGISHVYTVLPPILQDTVVVIPPYPFTLQDPQGVPCAIPCRKVAIFSHSLAPLAMRPTDTGHQVGPLWQFWRGKSCLRGLSVADTEDS